MNGLSTPEVIVAVVAIVACVVLLVPAVFWLWIRGADVLRRIKRTEEDQ